MKFISIKLFILKLKKKKIYTIENISLNVRIKSLKKWRILPKKQRGHYTYIKEFISYLYKKNLFFL